MPEDAGSCLTTRNHSLDGPFKDSAMQREGKSAFAFAAFSR
jgi:hypothetical protein